LLRWRTRRSGAPRQPINALVLPWGGYLYGKLEGARAGLAGPCTFGEIAYLLLNQTMVYFDVVDAAETQVRRGVAERMAFAH